MGVQIRTIVKDNVAIRCDGCLEVIDGTPWRVNLLDIVAAEVAGRLDRATGDQPRPVPVPPRPGLRPPLDGRQGLPVLPARRGPRDHAPGRASRPIRPRWGLCDGIHRDDHEFVPA